MDKALLKKPWMIALVIFAAIGLLALGFFGSQMILGRQIAGDAFPQARFAVEQFADGERLGGEIVALSENQLSIESPDGEVHEFNVTSATELGLDGGLDALEVGAFSFVQYESADDGSLTALFVGSAPQGAPESGGRGPGGGGAGGRGQQQ
jgi:hypothetical protein